jgi:sugar phosphate isomerase/epimerase
MKTRTGNFPIGFRLGWSEWYKNLPALAAWAKESSFEAIDLGAYSPEASNALQSAGLKVGTVDLLSFGKLSSTDEGARRELIAKNIEYIQTTAAAGAKLFFTIIPGEPGKPRSENYKLAVETFQPLAEAADKAGATIVIEGYPGGPPHYAVLCCTPESCRAILRDCGPGMGLNYDPSHLIRLGVDPIRFLNEFVPYIHHVHGKDTELFAEAQYEFGIYQDSVFQKPHGFGQNVWRYTIPGHGQMPWSTAFAILKEAEYDGVVSIELEDEHYNGSEAGERAGLLASLDFLKNA